MSTSPFFTRARRPRRKMLSSSWAGTPRRSQHPRSNFRSPRVAATGRRIFLLRPTRRPTLTLLAMRWGSHQAQTLFADRTKHDSRFHLPIPALAAPALIPRSSSVLWWGVASRPWGKMFILTSGSALKVHGRQAKGVRSATCRPHSPVYRTAWSLTRQSSGTCTTILPRRWHANHINRMRCNPMCLSGDRATRLIRDTRHFTTLITPTAPFPV